MVDARSACCKPVYLLGADVTYVLCILQRTMQSMIRRQVNWSGRPLKLASVLDALLASSARCAAAEAPLPFLHQTQDKEQPLSKTVLIYSKARQILAAHHLPHAIPEEAKDFTLGLLFRCC